MEYFAILIFLFTSFVCMVPVVSHNANASCCQPGQTILKRKSNPHHCWDPKTNTTTFIPLKCNLTEVLSERSLNFTVNEAGQLEILLENLYQPPIEVGQFCVGYRTNPNNVNLTHTVRVVVLCYEEETKIIDENVMGYCLIVSVIFLTLTTIVYLALPEIRDLQGKSIINFCGSLAIGLGLLDIMRYISYTDMNHCAARGFFTYFFIMAAFFWTNAISIQILLSIRRPSVNYGWKEFMWYAIYAWGSPALLSICMAIVNFIPGKHYKPGIGLNHCWFFTKQQQWIYMYSVMTILISANICIFIYISVLLWRQSFASSHVKALKYKFTMTLRLVLVMGLPWIFEMITASTEAHMIWVILDLFNMLQGPLIFLLLVVFRRRVVKAMFKHGWLCCLSGAVERYLAAGDDDEENIIQHTIVIPMEDKTIT